MTEFLCSIIRGINTFTNSYGWAIVVFTILVRLVLMPLEVKSRKGMRQMQALQPQMEALQKKYANDKEKLTQKQQELYRKAHYNPLSGCLPMLIQMPILFLMFGAMRQIANEQLAMQAFAYLQGETPLFEGWLWVKNVWMPDSPFSPLAPDLNSLNMIPWEVWTKVYATLSESQAASILAHNPTLAGLLDFTKDGLKDTLSVMLPAMQSMPAYVESIQPLAGWQNISFIFFKITVYVRFNGLFLLPILAAVTQYLQTALNPQMQQQPSANGAGTGNFMKYFFPLFSLFICSSYNAAFAVYWVVVNIVAGAQSVVLDRYFTNKEKKETATIGEGTVK